MEAESVDSGVSFLQTGGPSEGGRRRGGCRRRKRNLVSDAQRRAADEAYDDLARSVEKLKLKRNLESFHKSDALVTEHIAVEEHNAYLSNIFRRASPSTSGTSTAAGSIQQQVASLLREQGSKLKSHMMSTLATHVQGPISRVKDMIEKLIVEQQEQAAQEQDQAHWCAMSTQKAEQKRDFAAEDIQDLNTKMASVEALIDDLAGQLKEVAEDKEELEAKQNDALAMREEEKAGNSASFLEARRSHEAALQAIDILTKFYAIAAKAKEGSSLLQEKEQSLQVQPASGLGFDEAYGGNQAGGNGILGMLDIVQAEFKNSMTAAQKDEEEAAKEFNSFLTESKIAFARKEVVERDLYSQKEEAEQALFDSRNALDEMTTRLQGIIKELFQLKDSCFEKPLSYEEKKALREQEILTLKQALCMLGSGSAACEMIQ